MSYKSVYVDITELGKNILMRNEASIEDAPENIVHSWQEEQADLNGIGRKCRKVALSGMTTHE